ncbi:glycosyltransferase family 4 protein [bacterium]|nr:glycosyltransferase family 4 protein [bacterium]
MKILHVITRLIQGGAQENTVYTALGQAKLGHEVTLLHGPELNGESRFLADLSGLKEETLPSLKRALSPYWDVKAYHDLKKYFRENSFDIIHTHSSKAGILGRLAAADAQTSAKIVHTIHGLAFDEFQSALKNKLYIAAEKKAAKVSDAIITVCDAMRDQALQAGIGRKELYHTVRSGSDLTAFQNAKNLRSESRQKLGVAQDELLFVAVTRLFPRKGAPEIIRSLPKRAKLLLVGGGPLQEELQSYAEKELKGRVIFYGQAAPEEIPALISAGDALVHASWREGLARVLIQALAEGIPVISSRAGGAAEAVSDGVNGFLFPIGDERALKTILERVASDPALLSKLKEGALKTDVSNYSIESMVAGTMEVYASLT